MRSGTGMQPGSTTSTAPAAEDMRLDTLGAETIGEVGKANADP